ncbi:MAG: amidohydrolase family protein [Rhizomicrobium sp.]
MVEGVASGAIDVIVSSHDPQAADTKRQTFAQAAFGAVGLETLLPVALQLHHNGHAGLPDIIDTLTAAPAHILGLDSGRLVRGAPADLVLFDPDESFCVDPAFLHSRARNTPFEGRTFEGRVHETYVNGACVFDRAGRDSLDHRGPIDFRAERRLHLAEGEIGADIEFVEREMMGGHAAGDRQAARFRSGDRFKRRARRNLSEMIARARQFDEPDVAFDDKDFRCGGRCGNSEPRGEFAFVHRGAQRKLRILGVPDYQCAESGGVGEGAAQYPRAGDRAIRIGECDGAGFH